MPTRITILFNNPESPEDFEALYDEGFPERARELPGVVRIETAKVWPKEDGTPTPAYRLVDVYFNTYEEASNAVKTGEAEQFFHEVSVLATNGFIVLFSDVEDY